MQVWQAESLPSENSWVISASRPAAWGKYCIAFSRRISSCLCWLAANRRQRIFLNLINHLSNAFSESFRHVVAVNSTAVHTSARFNGMYTSSHYSIFLLNVGQRTWEVWVTYVVFPAESLQCLPSPSHSFQQRAFRPGMYFGGGGQWLRSLYTTWISENWKNWTVEKQESVRLNYKSLGIELASPGIVDNKRVILSEEIYRLHKLMNRRGRTVSRYDEFDAFSQMGVLIIA